MNRLLSTAGCDRGDGRNEAFAAQQSQNSGLGAAASCSPPTQTTIKVAVDVPAMNGFAYALMHAINGMKITRAGWNASGQWVTSQWPDKGSKMGSPYLYLKNVQNEFVPWVPSQGDLFANDWALLP